MRTFILVVTVILGLGFSGFGQTDQPIIGSLSEIRGLTKYYVEANTVDRDKIRKELKSVSQFEPVNDPSEAQFFVAYKTISERTGGSIPYSIATGQMDVYFLRDGKKVLAWSASGSAGGYKAAVAGKLSGQFKKAFKKQFP